MTKTIWAQTVLVPVALRDDLPALEAFLQSQHDAALLNAAAKGVTINGTASVTYAPAVYVEDWSDEGSAVVDELVARMGGSDAPVTGFRVLMEWSA